MSPPEEHAVSAKTVIELVLAGCERCPDKPALIFEDGLELNRRALRDLVERFAATLSEKVREGERVAIVMDNRAEFMIAFFAVVANRAAVVPINPESGQVDATHVLRSSGAVIAIADADGATLVASCRHKLPELREVIVLGEPEPSGLPAGEDRLDLAGVACEPADIIAVTYTSGTTGLPKGALIDHVFILRVTDVALRVHRYGPEDRIFYPVKFFYIDALLALLRALQCGGAYVAIRKFSVSRFWEIARTHKVTILSMIGGMPAWLLKAPPSPRDREHSVRFAIQTQIPAELHEELDRRWGFPWLENYGMLEAGICCRVPVELAAELRGTGSVGPPAPEVSLRIVDDDSQEVAAGEVGEIVVRQPGMFRGYLDLPEATSELMRDGWIHTGDLGRLDDRGYLSIEGRKKDVIRRNAENISAAEVEMTLRGHEQIFDAAVLGVPDRDCGEEVKAYVQLVGGVTPSELSPEDIVGYCAARLARHKVPRYIEFVDDFPRTPSMRVRKEILRGQADLVGSAWDRKTGG